MRFPQRSVSCLVIICLAFVSLAKLVPAQSQVFSQSLFVPASSSLQARDSKFGKLRLPLGVSLEVPKNWWVLDGDINTNIETMAEAAMNLSGVELPSGKKITLFRANSMPETTYAAIAITALDSKMDPNHLRNASDREISDFAPTEKEMQAALSALNAKILDYRVRREFVGSHPALVIEYKRTGSAGPVIVQMTRLYLRGKEISLSLSYRESEGNLWRPIIQYITKSLSVAP